MKHSWTKYITVFLITAIVFGSAFALSDYLNTKRIEEVQATENKIALDILSNETQFQLLSQSSCATLGDSNHSALSKELGTLADQLSYTESSRGSNDPQVVNLKKYYSILQIKDIILMDKITEKCRTSPASIIYFYSNAGDCPDCIRTGYVLDELRSRYPSLRIYSFDYNLDLTALTTMVTILKIKNELPALVINDKVYYGFKGVEDVEKMYPALAKLNATSTPTAPKKK